MRHNYCTVYSRDYVYMGLVLYNSLLKYDKDFCLYIFFMDDEAYEIMNSMNLEHAVLISLKDVEDVDPELRNAKSSRTDKEYSWTIKGSVLLYLFWLFEDMDHVIWLDGDLKFYSDPQPIFDEFEKSSILLTEEKYTGPYEYLSKIYGVYQLGFIGFKREENVLDCLRWYRERLLEWCHERPEEGKWSDQRYAVDWPASYKNVGIVQNIAVNLTPFMLYRFQQENLYLVHEVGNEIYIDDTRLVFFHYYGFKYYDGNEFDLCRHWMKFSDSTLKLLYLDYISSVNESIKTIREHFPCYYMHADRKDKYVSNYFNLEIAGQDDLCFYYTIADSKCVANVIALNDSISSFMTGYRLWVCCLDEDAYTILKNAHIPNLLLIDSKNLEDSDLSRIKDLFGKQQYRILLKTAMAYFILKNNYSVEKLMYVDSGMYFFSSPAELFDSWKEGCIFIHNSSSRSEKPSLTEILCTGLIGFLRQPGTIYFIEDFLRTCINCHNSYVQSSCPDMAIADYYGIVQARNLAANIDISLLKHIESDESNGKLVYLGEELISFNFSASRDLKLLARLYEKGNSRSSRNQVVKRIYQPYLNSLKEVYRTLRCII